MSDPNFDNLILLIPNDHVNYENNLGLNTFIDRSPQQNQINAINSSHVYPSTIKKVFGTNSIMFENERYLQLASNPQLAFGTSDFKIELFFHVTGGSDATFSITNSNLHSSGGNGWSLYCRVYSSTVGGYVAAFRAWNNFSFHRTTTLILINTWYHLVVTRSSGTLRGYLNGVKEFEVSGFNFNFSEFDNFRIGATSTGTLRLRYLDGLRIVKDAAENTGETLIVPVEPFYYPEMPALTGLFECFVSTDVLFEFNVAEIEFDGLAGITIFSEPLFEFIEIILEQVVEIIIFTENLFEFSHGKLPSIFVNSYILGADPSSVKICSIVDYNRKALKTLLQNGALRDAEKRVNDYYGLFGDGEQSIEIKLFYEESYGMLEYIKKTTRNGQTHYILGIDMVDFYPPNKIVNQWDIRRALAHEMVHVLMHENFPLYSNYPLWFREGQAEFIHGANARVFNDLKRKTSYELMQYLDVTSYTQADAVYVYSAGYIAVRYLHDLLKPVGLLALLNELKTGKTFSQALVAVTIFTSESQFRAQFKSSYGIGVNYTDSLKSTGQLTHADTGAIGGYWADNGPILTNETVINSG